MARSYGKFLIFLCCLFAPILLILANDFMRGISKNPVGMPDNAKRSLPVLSHSDIVAGLKEVFVVA